MFKVLYLKHSPSADFSVEITYQTCGTYQEALDFQQELKEKGIGSELYMKVGTDVEMKCGCGKYTPLVPEQIEITCSHCGTKNILADCQEEIFY